MQGLPTKEWRRGEFLLSTDVGLIDLDAVNDAFASDSMPWAVRLPLDTLRTAINSCLCFGLYHCPEAESDSGTGRRMIGLSRVVTDFVTFGYLTDVYILEEFRGKGLGKWMMQCLGQHIDQWPFLRRMMLLTMSAEAAELYKKSVGVIDWSESPSSKLTILEKRGNAAHI
ncbi:related to GNAT family N-acetyltransferase [Cephalotrichum gorgonifer]|uniref:Related to GNAT family N-acetyltransferase n=1 Tax=Cephalotrichum gorgonifer TaxID=2041049 RepID=A0AAE8N3G8_9PEZI|nr:related to GNAT family N-acetyltransferase [Cephalotrichum gorgonifer]